MTKKRVAKKRPIINVILDRSGSMASIQDKTIQMFNEYLEGNRGARWTLTQFDATGFGGVTDVDTLYTARKGENVEYLTKHTYQPRGMTPLYDAIGQTLRKLDDYLKGQNGKKRKVIVAIITDGWENASVEYTQSAVKALVKSKEDMGWQFIFLGAGLDADLGAAQVGILRGSTVSYDEDSVGEASVAVAGMSTAYFAAAQGETITSSVDVKKDK